MVPPAPPPSCGMRDIEYTLPPPPPRHPRAPSQQATNPGGIFLSLTFAIRVSASVLASDSCQSLDFGPFPFETGLIKSTCSTQKKTPFRPGTPLPVKLYIYIYMYIIYVCSTCRAGCSAIKKRTQHERTHAGKSCTQLRTRRHIIYI